MTKYYLQLTDDQAFDLASGYVPNAIKAQLTLLLECDEEDRRRAERPLTPHKKEIRHADAATNGTTA